MSADSRALPAAGNYPGIYYELADCCVVGFRWGNQSGTTIGVLKRPEFVENAFNTPCSKSAEW